MNIESMLLRLQNHQTASSSSSSSTTVPLIPPSTELVGTDYPGLSMPPPDEDDDDDDIHQDYSDAAIDHPMVQGDIVLGTLTRGGKMICMNLYGYIPL